MRCGTRTVLDSDISPNFCIKSARDRVAEAAPHHIICIHGASHREIRSTMDGGRPGVGRRGAGGGMRRRGRRAQRRRRGFWVSLRGVDRGSVVQEGVDFAQDSEEGGADDFLFISDDSDEEIIEEFDDGCFTPNSNNTCANRSLAPLCSLDHPGASKKHVVDGVDKQTGDGVDEQAVIAIDEQLVDGVEGTERMGAVAWQDIVGHSQPLEETNVDIPDLQVQDGDTVKFREVRDSMLKILVPLYFQIGDK